MELDSVLRQARRRAGLTQAELATASGLSAATLSRAETGAGTLSAERVEQLASILGIDVGDLTAHRVVDGDSAPTPGLFVDDGPGAWRTYGDLRMSPHLAAALEAFTALGYHGTSVRDVARIAGTSVPGLYHHFPSKQSLLVALMDLTMEDFRRRCLAARDEGVDATARFAALVECFALFHSNRRELAFIGASEMRSLDDADRSRIAAVRAECQHMVTEEVEQMAASGELATPFPEDAARAVVTMLVGIANWYREDGLLSPEQVARRYVVHSLATIQRNAAEQ